MCEISIIVPVYKVEKYLRKCVDSILAQTFTDFEVILVDDGSPDNSGKICDEYAEKDNRVRVIHKENGGLSSARNAGIDVARGKYLGFVDSDDY
ncbi:glycosyl transferase family 2, partial [Enterococcus faecium]